VDRTLVDLIYEQSAKDTCCVLLHSGRQTPQFVMEENTPNQISAETGRSRVRKEPQLLRLEPRLLEGRAQHLLLSDMLPPYYFVTQQEALG